MKCYNLCVDVFSGGVVDVVLHTDPLSLESLFNSITVQYFPLGHMNVLSGVSKVAYRN